MYLVNKITGLSDKLYLWKEQPDWYLFIIQSQEWKLLEICSKLNFLKTLCQLFIDRVPLSQGCRATTRKQFAFNISPQEFLVFIWSLLEGWKAKSTLKPPSGFEPRA